MTTLTSVCVALGMLVLVSTTVSAVTQPIEEGCMYETRIHELSREIEAAGSVHRMGSERRYVDFVRELNEFDNYSQFQMCTDEDGNASLKFNTPEERLRDSIAGLLSWVSWFASQAGSFATAPKNDRVSEEIKSSLDDMQSMINTRKTRDLILKGPYEQVAKEYKRLKKARADAINNLTYLADRNICRGLTQAEMELAELYHDIIPQNRSCNDLERRALFDRIRRIRTIGFGSLFDPETYGRMKRNCPQLEAAKKKQECPDVAGKWEMGGPYNAGKPASIAQQGPRLQYTNENGDATSGACRPDGTLEVPGWDNLTGRLSAGRDRIDWSNGTWWVRPRPQAGRESAEYVVWLHPAETTCCPADTNGEPNYSFHGTTADHVKQGAIVLQRFRSEKDMMDWTCNRQISPHYWAGTYAKMGNYHVTQLPCGPSKR